VHELVLLHVRSAEQVFEPVLRVYPPKQLLQLPDESRLTQNAGRATQEELTKKYPMVQL